MVGSRTATAAVFLVGSLLASLALWVYFDTVLFFLFIPFLPFLFRGLGKSEESEQRVKSCSQCGFQTVSDEYEYCPRDGRRLVERHGAPSKDDRTDW